MPHSTNTPAPLDSTRSHNHTRWGHTRFRRRLLEGHWEDDARKAVEDMAGTESADNWPPADTSKNLFRDVVDQISVLYDSEGGIKHEDNPDAVALMSALTMAAKFWPTLSENQRFAIGLRESFVRIDVVETEGGRKLVYRVVPPDLLIVKGNPNNPAVPVYVEEYRPRVVDGEEIWTRDILDIRNPKNPKYRVETVEADAAKKPKNLTRKVLGASIVGDGTWSGEGYPYRTEEGTPFIPGVLYHARVKWRTWDWRWGIELTEATLRVAVFWTFWGHCYQSCSWPQWYGLDVQLAGGATSDANRSRAKVDIDAGTVMLFRSMGDKGGSLGSFPNGSDPHALGEALRAYSADSVSNFGINPADAQRVSADPRSGYAISLSRTMVREQQDKQVPIFKPFDRELLEKTAAVWNRLGDSPLDLPETGWDVEYTGLPLTAEERRDALAEWTAEAAQGVASKVDLYMRINRVSREVAILRMRKLREETAEFGAPGNPAP